MSRMKRFGHSAIGIVVGLGLAGVAYYMVSFIGVAVSGAETVGELPIGWFPIRALVAFRVASVSGGWVYGHISRKW